ncbi:S8 family peptidase [Dyadobacter diqingensis]|uniref:S8 family peptidase n=1 Tax=Dyadobacter diqingensis TaxID=2938121 RepID=UPI0020C1A26B|nr:S8 family peptidase [Dyadobacter diqingensis]
MKLFKIIVFSLPLVAPYLVFAQTEAEVKEIQKYTQVEKLVDLGRDFSVKFQENKKKAMEIAKAKSWPIVVNTRTGTKKLIGVTEDLQPIYNEALDSQGNVTVRANTLWTGGSLGLNVHGESITAGVWDVIGVRLTHQAFESRVRQIDTTSIFNPVTHSTLANDYSHPTFVTGQIIASGDYNSDAYFGSVNYGKGQGAAFKGNVDAYDSSDDLGEVAIAAAHGLLLSNHSYGSNAEPSTTGSWYDSRSRGFDVIMSDAPYYLSIFACGNGGGPIDQLSYLATSKNGIAVSNTNEVLDYTGPSSVIIANSSSRGPSDDYRVKPDISASGSYVRCVAARGDNDYTNGTGTSLSAPTVTGALMLLQQHYVNINHQFMRSSTVKGLALHTADEAGSNPGPDITFGWGLINAKRSAETITNNGGTSLISEDSLATGSLYNRELIASGNEPLVATICWTDLPGISVGDNNPTPQLVNDLDLRVISNGTTYYPWKLDLSNVTGPAIQGDNDRDNIEKIEIPSPVAGQVYILKVNHKGTLASNGQRFSVIVTGLEECVANRNIVSSVNAVSVDHQQASARILATNTVNANAEAVYHAGDEVLMTDGFTAIGGSTYRAYIENCTNDYAARKAVVERPVVTYNIPRPKEEIALADNAVYPNPGNGIFNVRVAGLSEGFVQITNLKGTEFYNRKFKDQGELSVNIKNEAPGMYIVRVVSGNKVYTKTIVKF